MKLYELHRTTIVAADLKTTWHFFSDPRNLPLLIPPDISLHIVNETGLPARSHTGMLIAYTIKPLSGISMNWLTELRAVAEDSYFIDEQRFGPYAFWYHEHYFETGKHAGETIMRDKVTYALPFGLLGRIVHTVWVGAKLRRIFDYRTNAIHSIFPARAQQDQ